MIDILRTELDGHRDLLKDALTKLRASDNAKIADPVAMRQAHALFESDDEDETQLTPDGLGQRIDEMHADGWTPPDAGGVPGNIFEKPEVTEERDDTG
jgi:hypothetical protein